MKMPLVHSKLYAKFGGTGPKRLFVAGPNVLECPKMHNFRPLIL